MKLLLCADVHAERKTLRKLAKLATKVDAIVVAGDLSVFGEGLHETMLEFNRMEKPVFIVHGNHDDEDMVRKKCERLRNLTFIHKRKARFNGITFIGHGGEGFALESKDFDKFSKRVKKQPGEKIVFVTHQPPHGCKIDYIWDHHGSKSYRRFNMKKKPVLHVCGHLHETAGLHDHIGKTKVINPGPGIIEEL